MRSETIVSCWNRAFGPFLLVLFLIASSVVLLPSASAQTTGTITGTVYDSSGAVVPGAKIVLVNEATNDQRETVSNDSGYFSFAGVLAGGFSISVEAKGFKKWEIKNFGMDQGDKRAVPNINLVVGAPTDTVVVESSIDEVRPQDSGDRTAVISDKDIQRLGIQGRGVTELLRILPGTSVTAGSLTNQSVYDPTTAGYTSAVGAYSMNGSQPQTGGMDLVSDGAHVIDPGCNCSSTQNINADMVEEVKVNTSAFGADNAKGPVVINAVGKSGSSQFHGEGYLYARDSVLNANRWDYNAAGQAKPGARYMYPGGNVGGPVRIPGTNFNHQNKLFFWTGYEYYYQTYPGSLLEDVVPTSSMRSGNFDMTAADNVAICAGRTWTTFCQVPTFANGSKSTTITVDPGAAALLKIIPAPNVDPTANNGFNYIFATSGQTNGWQSKSRIDYNFTDNTKLYFTYNFEAEKDLVPIQEWWTANPAAPFPGGMSSSDKSHTFAITLLHVFSPTLTNEATFAFSRLDIPLVKNDPSLTDRTALGYPYQGVFKNGATQVPSIVDWWWQPGAGYPQVYQPDLFENGGAFELKKNLPSFSDNLTKTWKTHTFKIGAYIETTANNQATWGYPNGLVSFGQGPYCGNVINQCVRNASGNVVSGGIGTNNAVANLDMGVVSSYSENNFNALTNMAFRTYAGYIQDSWKVSKHLTIEPGLRIDHLGNWYDLSRNGFAVWLPKLLPSDVASGVAIPGIRWNSMDPGVPSSGSSSRIAWFSPRFGMAYDVFATGKTVVRGGWGQYRWHDAFNDYSNALAISQGSLTFSNLNEPAMSLAQIDQIASPSANGVGTVYAINPRDDFQPVTYNYNLTISQRLPWSSLLEVAYVGNQTKHMLLEGNLQNVNSIPLGAYFGPDPITGQIVNPNNAVAAHYRPYGKYYSGAIDILSHESWANYNGLQVSWVRQQGRFTTNLNYAFSKALGVGGDWRSMNSVGDPTNPKNDYGVLAIDHTHIFNASYSVDTGRVVHGNRFIGGALNSWTISGITSFSSGPNLQAAYNLNFSLGGTDSTGAQVNAANILGSPDFSLQPLLTCNPRSGLGKNQYVNGSCFAIPTAGGKQNGPYFFPYLKGPAFFNSDLSIFKTFHITERQGLQFRFSAFNFLNHPLPTLNGAGQNNLTLSFANGVLQTGAGQTSQYFGYANSKLGQRIVQLGLKYSF